MRKYLKKEETWTFYRILILKKTLIKNELKACELILIDIDYVQRYSLTEMSERIDITKTTILRFCQKMGYSSDIEFKYDCYVHS